jgi:hypothetical protein
MIGMSGFSPPTVISTRWPSAQRSATRSAPRRRPIELVGRRAAENSVANSSSAIESS